MIDWAEEDLQFIAENPLAVRCYTSEVECSANRMVINENRPDLIEPDKIIEGSFTKIMLFLMYGKLMMSHFEIPFIKMNPSQRDVADAIWLWGSQQFPPKWGDGHPYGEVHSVKVLGDVLAIECRLLADL